MAGEYEAYLDRALEQIPEVKAKDSRFVVPSPRVMIEGKTTVLENFENIVNALNRDPDHVLKYLLRELGTAGRKDGSRAIFQGRFTEEQIAGQLASYVQEFVICSECGLPDTHLVRTDRILMLHCDACGAHRSLKKRYRAPETKKEGLSEGETLEVRIESTGSKGDGIAKVGSYTIFVPGARRGDVVKIKVKKIAGKLVFTELTPG